MTDDSAGSTSLVPVVKALLHAHHSGDWEGLRAFFHPDARIGVFAAGGSPVHPEDAIRAMQQAHGSHLYQANVAEIEELDDAALVLTGSVRYPRKRGFAIASRAWVYVFRDRLLYRSAVFADKQAAVSAYRTDPDLGAPAPQPGSEQRPYEPGLLGV